MGQVKSSKKVMSEPRASDIEKGYRNLDVPEAMMAKDVSFMATQMEVPEVVQERLKTRVFNQDMEPMLEGVEPMPKVEILADSLKEELKREQVASGEIPAIPKGQKRKKILLDDPSI